MSNYHLAQLNIALPKGPMDSQVMADFVANLDRINALAEASPGFKWRLQEESGNATGLRPFGDDIIVNMSVWEDVQSLSDFAFKSGHVDIMKRRREWFERMMDAYAVLWWVQKGHQPTVEEAKQRLDHIRHHGPSPRAFTFKSAFPPPDAVAGAIIKVDADECPA